MDKRELFEANEEYEELKLTVGTDLETAVNKLLELKRQGKKAYCEFSGVTLDSETVTMDGAFLMITGCTKEELELIEKRNAKERILLAAIDRIPEQIKKGRNHIYPNHFQDWVRDVSMCAIGPTKGKVIDNVLDIMEAIDSNRTLDEIVNIYKNQTYKTNGAWCKELVRTYVMTYSKNGYPFYEATRGEYCYWTLDECEKLLNIISDNEAFNKDSSEEVVDTSESKQKILTNMGRLVNLRGQSNK